MYDCRVRCERSGYCYGYLIKSDFHFFFVVFKGLTVWPRRCAQKAILDATEVFFAFLSTVINNTVTVKEISPPTPLFLLHALNRFIIIAITYYPSWKAISCFLVLFYFCTLSIAVNSQFVYLQEQR